MQIDISILSFLIGFIAGTIYYIDSWGPTVRNLQDFSSNKRYRGLIILAGGGVITPIIDKFIIETHKFDFFQGYLLGATIGWLVFFILGLFLYVVWKNTRNLIGSRMYTSGQICYSILEFIYLGIADNPHLNSESDHQLIRETYEHKVELGKLEKQIKKDNPSEYLRIKEQQIGQEKISLQNREEQFKSLKESLENADNEPIDEAEKLVNYQNKSIETLKAELELAKTKSKSEYKEKIPFAIDYYNKLLDKKEKEKRELEQAINEYKQKEITKSDFAKLIKYQKINQYELGGLILGKLTIKNANIKIYRGDIINLLVDVIVSSDDNHLSMGGGVSMSIKSAGGIEIYNEARRHIPLKLGDVQDTTAGKLSARKIYHSVVIDSDKNLQPTEEVIKGVIKKCLLKANKENYTSIAFPLLGTGTGGFPAYTALEIMLEQIIQEINYDNINLSEIYIVLYGKIGQALNIDEIIKKIQSIS